MKKENSLLKTALIGFLSTVIAGIYITKVKSIVLGVSAASYIIYASTIALCFITMFSKLELSNWYSLVRYKSKKASLPKKIYTFCRKRYFEDENSLISFVNSNGDDTEIKSFFCRFLDKNTSSEISEYLNVKRNLFKVKEKDARRVSSYINLCLVISTAAGFIYDSNIKGLILITGVLSLVNIFTVKLMENSIEETNQIHTLFENIYEDILSERNAKYVMYKCENLLLLEEEEELSFVESTKTLQSDESDNKKGEVVTKKQPAPSMMIEGRKSKLVTISKKQSSVEDNHRKIVN